MICLRNDGHHVLTPLTPLQAGYYWQRALASGLDRVGVRRSSWSTFQVLKAKDLNLAFIHLIEARVS
ncbi:hypothetical protein PG985_003952 [Apiospora marii]|uniref:uncharacterized protein n=1 Tax=Apiospora marii TaxID=335849 RepID=UPI00313017AA